MMIGRRDWVWVNFVTISVERQLMVDVTWLIFMSFLTAEIQ